MILLSAGHNRTRHLIDGTEMIKLFIVIFYIANFRKDTILVSYIKVSQYDGIVKVSSC